MQRCHSAVHCHTVTTLEVVSSTLTPSSAVLSCIGLRSVVASAQILFSMCAAGTCRILEKFTANSVLPTFPGANGALSCMASSGY